MSYGSLYKIQYYDNFDVFTEIYIKKEGYSGSTTDISAGDDPLRISLNNSGQDKFQYIRGTNVEIDLLSESDFQFISLYTSDFKQYQIQIDKGGSTYWKGWLLPDYYQEPYQQPPYIVTINASDGLGLLKNYDLVHSNGSHLTGKQTIGDILNQIFLKIGTELNLYENINIYEDNINSTAADSILYQIYIDTSIFYDIEGNPMNCYDTLVELLKITNAYIIQTKGTWQIIRVPTNKETYTRRLFTWNTVVGFTYDSNESHDPQLSTTSATEPLASLVRLVGNTLTVSPPWKQFTIRQDYGTKNNLLSNGEFSYDTFSWNGVRWYVDEWTDYGEIAAPDYSPSPVNKNNDYYVLGDFRISRPNRSNLFKNLILLNPYPNNEYCIKINSSGVLPVVGIYNKEIDLISSTDNLLLHFEYCTNNASDNVYAQVLIDGSSLYYLNIDGSWGLVTDYLDFGSGNASNQWITKEIYTDDIPISGTLYIVLFYMQGGTDPLTTWVKWSNIKINYLPDGIRPEKELELTTSINSNNIYIPADVDLIIGDIPDHDNNAICYTGALFYKNDDYVPTSIWTDQNSSKNDTLINCLAEGIAFESNVPYQIITGTIYSKLIDWTTIIRETNNSNYLFMINGGTFHDKSGAWDVELIQFAETYDLLAEDSSTLITEDSNQLITE